MIAIKIFILLCFAFLTIPFSKASRIIIYALLNQHSFRMEKSMQTSLRTTARYYLHAIYFILKKQPVPIWQLSKNQSVAIFDGKKKSISDRFNYLDHLNTQKPSIGVSRETLFISKPTNKVFALFFSSVLFGVFLPISIFTRKRRGSIALIMLEFVEWIALTETLRMNNIKYLYHFSSYEKDAPFIGWLNNKFGITNHKIPSSNPLSNFYNYTYCDVLAITTPFQIPEIDLLSNNWRVKAFSYWPIENFQKLLPYLNKEDTPNRKKYQLGFLSSGIWLRQKQGHTPLGIGDQESELALLELLREFLNCNPNTSFIILLHPIEKQSEDIYKEACENYRTIFNNIPLNFGIRGMSSFEYFDSINTSIAAYSSTNLQRLFCGYKTLYAPLKFSYKIYQGSSIQNIAPTNKKQLFEKLDSTLKLSDKEFFTHNNLWEYHYSKYEFVE